MDIVISDSANGKAHFTKAGFVEHDIGAFQVYTRESTAILNHFARSETAEGVGFVWGRIYSENGTAAAVCEAFAKSAEIGVSRFDGDFIFGYVSKRTSTLTIIADREGLLPVYYRVEGGHIILSSDSSLLMKDYSEGDIDVSALYDFVRFGTFLGQHTISKKVKFLPGGHVLTFSRPSAAVREYYRFYHDEERAREDFDKLSDDIMDVYENAIRKRLRGYEERCGVFLSGGMDSRLILAMLNNIVPGKAKCFTWGQKHSEEIQVAREAAELMGNEFYSLSLTPNDFIKQGAAYMKKVSGCDLVVESYLLQACDFINGKVSGFITGFTPETHIGGWSLSKKAIGSKQRFSEYLRQNIFYKIDIIRSDEMKSLCRPEMLGVFEENSANLFEEAKKYDDHRVEDAEQSFWTEQRSKRMVILRELIPAFHADNLNPNFDRDLLSLAAKIPAKIRYGRRFYRHMFLRYAPAYADIVSNNMAVPLSTPFELWRRATDLVDQREKLYEEIQKAHNSASANKLFFPHYYSDFVGYIRYDDDWRRYINEMLLSPRCFIADKFFNREYIASIINDHRTGLKNNRRQVLMLLSIEQFFRAMFAARYPTELDRQAGEPSGKPAEL